MDFLKEKLSLASLIIGEEVSTVTEISAALDRELPYIPSEEMSSICKALPKIYSKFKPFNDCLSVNYKAALISIASAYLQRDNYLFNGACENFLGSMVDEAESPYDEFEFESRSSLLH
ncbi:MAG: hypothetical protein ABIH82_01040 [Candidatus Woesearchaeota archaeon]